MYVCFATASSLNALIDAASEALNGGNLKTMERAYRDLKDKQIGLKGNVAGEKKLKAVLLKLHVRMAQQRSHTIK